MHTRSNGSPEPSRSFDDHDPSPRSSQNYQERSVDPPGDHPWSDATLPKNARLKDADGQEAETVGFIPGSDEPRRGANTCRCRCGSVVCRVLTCGLYRVCQRTLLAPCLTGPLDRDRPETREEGEEQEREREEYRDMPAWLEDVHLDGVKVDIHDLNVVTEAPSSYGRPPRPSSPKQQQQQQQQTSHQSYVSMTLSDWEGEEEVAYGEGVDALITKKLLELYTEYQIEELARCTSDSVFLRKSKKIHQLIYSLAEEHQMDEHEAECRLVHGVIRISTRRHRSKKRGPHYTAGERTPSDSGNETMRNSGSFYCSNNNDYKSNHTFQISEVTNSDMDARKMRKNNIEVLAHGSKGASREQDSAQTAGILREQESHRLLQSLLGLQLK
ncbi:unnamed protein product [Merluccius merluccius]